MGHISDSYWFDHLWLPQSNLKVFGPFRNEDWVPRSHKSKFSKNEKSIPRNSPKLSACQISDRFDHLWRPKSTLNIFSPFKIQDWTPRAQKSKFSKNEKNPARSWKNIKLEVCHFSDRFDHLCLNPLRQTHLPQSSHLPPSQTKSPPLPRHTRVWH